MEDKLLLRFRVRPRIHVNYEGLPGKRPNFVSVPAGPLSPARSPASPDKDPSAADDAGAGAEAASKTWKAWAGEPGPVETHFMEVPARVGAPIKKLRDNLANYLFIVRDGFHLLYHGAVLDDEETIDSVGLEPHSTVHVVHLPVQSEREPPPPAPPVDLTKIGRLSFALQSAMVYPRFHRSAISSMLRGDMLDSIIAATPGLAEDRTAIALISDPLLLLAAAETEALKMIWKRHHCLIEALDCLAGSIHGEQTTSAASLSGFLASRNEDVSADLESLSDDEIRNAIMDDDEEEEDGGGDEDPDSQASSGAAAAAASASEEGAVGGDGAASASAPGGGARPRQSGVRGRQNQVAGQAAAGGASAAGGSGRGQRRRRPRSRSDSRGGQSSSRQRTQPPLPPSASSSPHQHARITCEQLAAALRQAEGSVTGAGASGGSSTSSSAADPQPAEARVRLPQQPVVTLEMFQEAISRATDAIRTRSPASSSAELSRQASTSTRESTPATASASDSSAASAPAPAPAQASANASPSARGRFPPITPEREAQIRMLEELGFLNPAENLQALEATNGDVDAAVGLIISMRE